VDEDEEDEDEEIVFVPRKRLPAPAPVNQSFSLWSILRQSMGKDLSRISMPATINQPLSILQVGRCQLNPVDKKVYTYRLVSTLEPETRKTGFKF
jgi:hypothetical protein